MILTLRNDLQLKDDTEINNEFNELFDTMSERLVGSI